MKLWKKEIFKSSLPNAGWTILEVLIGLTVLVVIFLVSAPGVNSLAQKYSLKKTSSNLLSSIELAQTEAARRRNIVTLCPSSDGNSCRTDGDWNRGWLLFIDGNANNKPEPVEILKSFDSPGQNVRVHVFGAFSSEASFDISGSVAGQDVHTESGFTVCNASGEPGFHQVRINHEGLIQPATFEGDCSRS
jgi:Tfp pilus assembly protein FimT